MGLNVVKGERNGKGENEVFPFDGAEPHPTL